MLLLCIVGVRIRFIKLSANIFHILIVLLVYIYVLLVISNNALHLCTHLYMYNNVASVLYSHVVYK
jgi:hypothetical protein